MRENFAIEKRANGSKVEWCFTTCYTKKYGSVFVQEASQ